MRLAKQAKRTALGLVRAAGGFAAVRESSWRRQRLLILCYHGVSIDDEHEWAPSYSISPVLLERRFRHLRDAGYSVLPLDEAVRRLREGSLPPKSVVLTFDDGLADFPLRAYPVLRQFGYPATVYLTTFYAGHQRPVFGVFASYLVWKGRDRGTLSRDSIGDDGAWDLTSASGRRDAVEALRRHAIEQELSTPAKDDLAKRLSGALGLDYEELVSRRLLQIMRPDEVQRMAEAGIRFELHTHRHRTPLDPALFRRELDDNRAQIHALAGQAPSHFCYPSGVYEHAFLAWLREASVVSATTCESGLATAATEPLLLPRVIDGAQLSDVEFESWTSGVGALLPHRVAHVPAA